VNNKGTKGDHVVTAASALRNSENRSLVSIRRKLEVTIIAKTSEPKKHPARKKPQHQEEMPKPAEDELHKALADSFPASDPPAPAIKGTTANPMPHEKDKVKQGSAGASTDRRRRRPGT
jgi:hypothetical protein